jgi:lipopolysaccharide transport system ATP-binding protein
MSDFVIRVENLSKRYTIRHQNGRGDGLRHAIHDFATAPLRWLREHGAWSMGHGAKNGAPGSLLSAPSSEFPAPGSLLPAPSSSFRPLTSDLRPLATEEFWALRGINFEVKQGEVLGIIGRNGAGKSTLLKILSRITEPTEGRVRIRGRVASLLEVGTGFHPELTGRENIFLNGAILGMTREEIRRKFDQIVDFSGVEKFIDTPVKWYSSGMYVRLAFAVAAHLEPEILIIDEVLAVGDAEFQKRCLGKMQDVASEGRTVLFVSHNMAAVEKLCDRVAVLNDGQLADIDAPEAAVRFYFKLTTTDSDRNGPVSTRGGGFELCGVRVEHEDGGPPHTRAAAYFLVPVQFARPCSDPLVHLFVQTADGETIFGLGSAELSGQRYRDAGTNFCFKFRVASLPLLSGPHRLSIKVQSQELKINERIDLGDCFEVANTPVYGMSLGNREWHGLAAVDASVDVQAFEGQARFPGRIDTVGHQADPHIEGRGNKGFGY